MKAVLLYLNGVEVGDEMEWDLQTEELLGGPGRQTLTIQDPGYAINPQTNWDIKAVVASNGWVLYRGYILNAKLDLPPGRDIPKWMIDCTDYNAMLDQRLLGAPDGTVISDQGQGHYVFVDPFANTLATDKVTVQAWFDHYFRVGTEAADTSTFVSEYLPAGSFSPIYWTFTTLKKALDDLAAVCGANLQWWLDPDLAVHWASVPAWYDLLQNILDPNAPLARLFPQALSSVLGSAPRDINDDLPPDGATYIGCRGLTFTFDGALQPEQVYVKGGTGYTYDTGVPPAGVTNAPTGAASVGGTYQLTVNSTTSVYTTDAQGYLANPSLTIDPGGPYLVTAQVVSTAPTVPTTVSYTIVSGDNLHTIAAHFYGDAAKWIQIYKDNMAVIEATAIAHGYSNSGNGHWIFPGEVLVIASAQPPVQGTSGYYWLMSQGPRSGYLIPQGDPAITVTTIPAPPPTPSIGIGGSGWVGGLQDPARRQSYVDDSDSTTVALRDSIGAQVIYRGSRPTLRGTLVIGGDHLGIGGILDPTPDGWRVGQVFRLTDSRLPTAITFPDGTIAPFNGQYFVIQRVATRLYAGADAREYTLDWGDGAVARLTTTRPAKPAVPDPAVQINVTMSDVGPPPDSSQVVTAQFARSDGTAVKLPGRTVLFSLEVVNSSMVAVTGQGSLSAVAVTSDLNGQARTVLTTGTVTGLKYFVSASSPVI
jgi:hypothetical protein